MMTKNLTVEELASGYYFDEEKNAYTCIFCGETFEDGIVTLSEGRYLDAERAVKEHIIRSHDSVFDCLINMDKDINGLSPSQKKILQSKYLKKDNKTISEEMGINIATVRTHKFHIHKIQNKAKIFLAILEQIENQERVQERERLEESMGIERK